MQELMDLKNKFIAIINSSNQRVVVLEKVLNSIDLSTDILKQLSPKLIKEFKDLIPSLDFSEDEVGYLNEIFDYYLNNSDYIHNLIYMDSKVELLITNIGFFMKRSRILKEGNASQIIKAENSLKIINDIENLLNGNITISLDELMNILASLALSETVKIDLLGRATIKNSEIYKINLANYSKQEKPISDNVSVDIDSGTAVTEILGEPEIIDVDATPISLDVEGGSELLTGETVDNTILNTKIENIIKEINKRINKVPSLIPYTDSKIYLIQSSLCDLFEKIKLKQSDLQDVAVFFDKRSSEYMDMRGVIISEIEKLFLAFEELKLSFDELEAEVNNKRSVEQEDDFGVKSEEVSQKDLLVLDSVFNDIKWFKRGNCEPRMSEDTFDVLMRLKDPLEIANLGLENMIIDLPIKVLRCKTRLGTGGSPRIYFTYLKDKIVILKMGIFGKEDQNQFKNAIENRLKSAEFMELQKANRLVDRSPNESYNDNQTNKEHLEAMYEYYRQREEDFIEQFRNDCYVKPSNELGGVGK